MPESPPLLVPPSFRPSTTAGTAAAAGRPTLVGRDADLAAATRALDAAADGAAAGLAATGPTGIGRTTFADEVAHLARARDFTTIVHHALDRRLPLLLAARVAEELQPGETPETRPAALARRARSELDALVARRRPAALVIDDLHRCSPEDVALIRDLARRPPTGPFALVVTAPRGVALTPEAAALLSDLRGSPLFDVVELPPLSAASIDRMIAAHPDLESRTASFTHDLAELTSGNPLQVRSVVDELLRLPPRDRAQILLGARSLTTIRAPERLRDRLAPALEALDADEGRLVRALAVWRAPATLADLQSLTGLDPETTFRAAEHLEQRGLILVSERTVPVRLRLGDPMLQLVVLEDTAVLERQRLHDRAAALLGAATGSGEEDDTAVTAAEHYVRGAAPIDAARLETVMRAARRLNATSRYAQSRDLLTRLMARVAAERHVDSVPEGAYALLAEASSRLGEWRDAEQVIATARPTVRDPDARARILMRAARDRVSAGHDAEALRLYRTLLDDPDLTPQLRLRAAEDAGRVADQLGRHDEARRLAKQAAEDAEQLGELELASDIWVSYHSLIHYAGEPRASLVVVQHALELARRSRSERAVARASMGVGNCLADLETLPRAIRWLRRSLQRAQRCGDSAALEWVSVRLAQAYQESGEWEEARAAARLAVQTDVALHRLRALAASRTTLSILESLRGRAAEAALQMELGASGLEGAHDDTNPRRGVAHAIAASELAWSHGDVAGAVERIDAAERLLIDETPSRRRTLLFEVYPRLAAMHLAAGDRDGTLRAVGAFDACLASIPEGASPLFTAQALAVRAEGAAAEGRDADAAAGSVAAAEAFGARGYRWRAARARHRAGALLAATDPDGAAEHLGAAFELLREMGAEPELNSVRRRLHDLGRRPPRARRSDGRQLTPRESQVLRLAAQGLRDAEIARMLWVSHRTVTTHMHNVLRKLSLRSRHELRGWLESNGDGVVGGELAAATAARG